MSEKERLGNSSLKRIFTGIVLAFVVLVATLSDGWLFFSIFWLVILVSAFEWTAFIGLTDYFSRVTYSLATLGLSVICSYATKIPGFSIGYILSGVILWFFLAIIIYRVSRGISEFPSRNCLSFAFLGLIIFSTTYVSVIYLYKLSPILVIVLISTVCAVDVVAYFGGKSMGRRRFVPLISPNKTWEGVWFGVVGGVTVALVLGVSFLIFDFFFMIGLSFATVFFAIVGDLLESLLKRISNLKDSGQLLPGHGGILDRVDSLLAGAPAFAGITFLAGVYD